jgi:hypothetical protein
VENEQRKMNRGRKLKRKESVRNIVSKKKRRRKRKGMKKRSKWYERR